jgi:Flp pilus assembly protein TadG
MVGWKSRSLRKRILAAAGSLRNENGGALVELALVFFFFLPPMMLGTIEFGSLMYCSIENVDAAHAGAAYAAAYYIQNTSSALPPVSVDQTSELSVTTVAAKAAPELQNFLSTSSSTPFSVTVTSGCGTAAPLYTNVNTVPSCASAVLPYITVTVVSEVKPLVTFPGFPGPFTLINSATMPLVQ